MLTNLPAADLLVAASPTLLRQGLLLTLREVWPNYPATLLSAPASLLAYLRERSYSLLILDSATFAPAVLPDLLAQVRQLRPFLPLLILTGRRSLSLALRPPVCLLSQQAPPTEVVRAAADLLTRAPEPTPRLDWPRPRLRPQCVGFSPRELEVLSLVVADLDNTQIADSLYLSVRTVESHRRALLQKAGVRTCIGLVVRALREGWVVI